MSPELLAALLDSIPDPIVFADTDHMIRFLNKAGAKTFVKWGGEELIGRSLLDFHNDASRDAIHEIFAAMLGGEDERIVTENERRRIYMRAVRDQDGVLLGYYERYEYPK